MELVLGLYLLPYDEAYPVVCFDERPCFLIGNTIAGFPMKPGQVEKENYAYSKHGSCCVLAMIEPKTGKRLAHIRKQRRKKEFCTFMQNLALIYPNAKKIRVVLDNLNTHNFSSFYEHLEADQASKLVDRFEFIYTPKSASWLNMIEIEFSALARQCLNRRISTMREVGQEVIAYFKERTEQRIKIDWQFSKEAARKKLENHYIKVNPMNLK
jgi:hypothetical protein